MANEKIWVNNFSNISLIDPNKIINENGFTEDRNLKQENLVFYVNLQCNVQPRSKLISGTKGLVIEPTSIAEINFLKPNGENYLTTRWTELLPINRQKENFTTELLGITNITYRCNASFTPTVDIILEDLKGRALFESGDNSIYSVFFNLPYPTFYLTLKGYYGKAVRYQLILQKFQASFDQSSGNFILNLNFLTYKFNVLNDLQATFLFALPSMYINQTTNNLPLDSSTSSESSVAEINGNSQQINTQIVYGGYEKIKEVYKIYKTKKLIPDDFPELTIRQLITKLENFEKNVLSSLGTVSVDELTDAENFRTTLDEYRKKIITLPKESVKNKYLNSKEVFYVKDINGIDSYKVFTYKSDVTQGYRTVVSEFKSEIEKYNQKLNQSATFGQDIEKNKFKIPINIKVESVYGSGYIPEIDIEETASKRYKVKKPTNLQINTIQKELDRIKEKKASEDDIEEQSGIGTPDGVPFFFRFDGPNFFSDEIDKISKLLDEKVSKIEENITKQISKILASKDKGIGFEPTIRNVIAVIMASSDAFVRSLEKVHSQAFENRNDPKKKKSCSNDVKDDKNSPVFPWPQYVKEILNSEGVTQYDLRYPGDPKYIKETGADDTFVWPEVEFIEEFVKGLTTREQPNLEPEPQDNITDTILRVLISGFDTPSNLSYSDLQSQKFYYEIWERISAISQYQGFERNSGFSNILNLLQAAEATNIFVALQGKSVDLISQIKESDFNSVNYINLLNEISNNGAGELYQNYIRGNINTDYLKTELSNSSKLLEKELPIISQDLSIEKEPATVENTLNKYLAETDKNFIEFSDTYPFVIPEWNQENLNNGANNYSLNKVLKTSDSLIYSTKFKKIINYFGDSTLDNNGDNTTNRPFTYLPSGLSKIQFELTESINTFFETRFPKNYMYTEGKIKGDGTNINKTFDFTSSIINTPFFIKAIQEGVNNEKSNSPTPYITASFLFLNSLPLSDVIHQYIDTNTDLKKNYIGPTLRKYGAIHSLPKMWVARVGSIWYRYKNFLENNTDILSNAFQSINYSNIYDPTNSSLGRQYNFNTSDGQQEIVYLQNSNQIIGETTTNLTSYTLGFYPKLLNDFNYFLNGKNLYETDLDTEIQQKIDSGKIIILKNSDSTITSPRGYDPQNLNNALTINYVSVLLKCEDEVSNTENSTKYFSAPSFGSRYTQVKEECFFNGILKKPIDSSVFNGAIRLFWGGSHFGYFPNVSTLCNFDEIPRTPSDYQWKILMDRDINSNENLNLSLIDFLLGTFTKKELDSFEKVFLDFSKSSFNAQNKFTLQNILREGLQVADTNLFNSNKNITIQNFQKKQQDQFFDTINNYINLNILFQKGNPTNLDYKICTEFTINPKVFLETDFVPKKYLETTNNALPSLANPKILGISQSEYYKEWIALKLNVGEFNFPLFEYSDNGSLITDFFIDLNIAFTVDNIERYASIIKVYATQKYLATNRNNFVETFKQGMTNFLQKQNNLRDQIFDGMLIKLRKALPNISIITDDDEDKSKTTGQQEKLEYYDIFKAINDKWISGNNFESETLFEDILFFDRANTDIGNKVIVNIFEVADLLKGSSKLSVYRLITSIIQNNNFLIFPMPSYINFYNVQNVGETPNPENEINFADSMFGTFTEVDYQNSKSKIVCQYTVKPSEQLKNPSQINGYKDDSWNFGNPVQNPTVRNDNENTNYALSNKVVGVNVDFGLQNQGVFKTIQVSQDLGKSTSESLKMVYDTANLLTGVKAFTQNVSLYNIYKSRSYSSTVTSFGNAMIQPTMYFNLQNVPLFSGPYLITDVEHVITPSDFTTKFTGTRQKLFSPPISNPLISVIKSNFIDKLINQLIAKKEKNATVSTNTVTERDTIANSIDETNTPSQNPQCKPITSYDKFTLKVAPTLVQKSRKEIQTIIFDRTTTLGNRNMSFVIYTLFYIKSYKENKFSFYENNVSQVPLGGSISESQKWGGDLSQTFKNEYMCLNNGNDSQAYAIFESIEKCVDFNFAKYKDAFSNSISNINDKNLFVSGFTRAWIEKVPVDKTSSTQNLYENFQITYTAEFEDLINKVAQSYDSVFANI